MAPTTAEPVRVTVPGTMPASTASVAAEDTAVVTRPVRWAVTSTEILLPTCPLVRASVVPVAPSIGEPSASHW